MYCTFQGHENSPHLHEYFAWVAPASCSSLGPVQRVPQEEPEEDYDAGEVTIKLSTFFTFKNVVY